ncbi:YkgJ family cysteine cluster protein [Sulfolobaceae archaeon RB850M]|jgi:Fe-S-cluster containining protein
MDAEQIHMLTKKALKGDLESLNSLFNFLKQYNDQPIAKYAMYAIVYQYIMNNVIDLGKECETCGGKCCKSGNPIPVYDFDYKELSARLRTVRVERFDGLYILRRPCPYQKGWMCTINSFKPYACLSYPFATEDEQMDVIKDYKDGIPDFKVPDFCIAGKKVKELIDKVVERFRREKGRDPLPEELLNEFLGGKA